jgi:hypothetical protein
MPANYVLISEQTVSTPVTSVTFSNIPQTGYTDLRLAISARATTGANWALIGINGGSDTASTLVHLLNNQGSVITQTYTSLRTLITGDGLTANTFGNSELYFTNYASTTANKSISGDGTQEDIAGNVNQQSAGFRWPFNTAISSLTLTVDGGGSFVAGSTFSLYGIAALGTTPTVLPKASGGDIVVNDGTYWYHAFLASGTFTPSSNLSCDVLQVAGGGGGGYWNGGGGGAGGLVAYTSESLTPINYSITVGAGGNGGTTGAGTFGTNSQFASLTASVGGGGGAQDSTSAANGGGSGGGAGFGGTGGNATSGQGNIGGNGDNAGPVYGGGGGGAGGAGTAGTVDGKGGIGFTSSLTNAMGVATSTGQLSSSNYYYAGGGSGGNQAGTTLVTGGLGGGGTSGTGYNATVVNPTAGTVNTGGGGGGGTAVNPGAAGGSGIVIIRYTMA